MNDYSDLIKLLGKLATEQVNENTIDIDLLSAREIARKINDEDKIVASVVESQLDPIAAAAELFAATLRSGGRVFYIGAGTSGRLGVLDAAECPPTFGTDPEKITGVISGGYDTLILSKEGVEDWSEEAVKDLMAHKIGEGDFVIGIAASRRTPYTLSGLDYAKTVGARTAFVTCNPIPDEARDDFPYDVIIELDVGPEAITGSTRLKSGSAQKMTLNMISTTAMVLLGKTYGNLMVDLLANSDKLAARSRKILMDLFELNLTQADELLTSAEGSVKMAIVMHRCKCNKSEAEELLKAADGRIRKIPE